ncbi:carboxypeptidase-like regulatory domain-containing protein [Candidatus Bacteroides intestinigallinarum]|uniref:carboxypeptidase-like regulatory domain-containing protein n=1 Tax=Candidatus Bacteroides intestinigallinarum TaxID=2838470 RepID=UPI0021654402|nr:carboxypeptidase-like regulatory domain-containing protein [Candidatus Bacteroides intestinigallinarum]MCS3201017.1 carboxypeptidase-like regulatory domain-containing protein [Candidatus Bacteroides intestinigallinarum]
MESILGTLLKDKNISFKVEDHIVYLLESPIGREKPTSKKQIVRGLITDDKGIPLTGVNISIKDMQTGSVSDIDGNYQIAVDTEKSDSRVFLYRIQNTGNPTERQEFPISHFTRGFSSARYGRNNRFGYKEARESPFI